MNCLLLLKPKMKKRILKHFEILFIYYKLSIFTIDRYFKSAIVNFNF